MPIYASVYNAIGDATQEILANHDIDVAALQAALDVANNRINTNETAINTNATIAQQLQEDLTALEDIVVNNAADINSINAAVATIQNTLSTFTADFAQVQSDVEANALAITDNASLISQNASAINLVEGIVAGQAADITAVEGSVSVLDQRVTANELAIDGIEVAIADAATDVSKLNNISNVVEATVYEDNVNVYTDAAPGTEDAALRDGWYYTNDGAGGFNKINWYYFAATQATVTLGDFSGYAVMTFDNDAGIPIMGVYTVPTGTNDAGGWYHSRKVFSVMSETPVVGQKYVVYFGQEPDVYPALPRIELGVSGTSTVGELLDSEIVLTSSFGTNSIAPAGDVQFLVEALGVNTLGYKAQANLRIHRASQKDFNALSSSVSANAAAITSNDTDIAELFARVVNAEGDILGNDTDIAFNAANIATNTAAIATLEAANVTATADITANANAISALDTRVTDAEADIVTNASAITSLQSTVGGYAGDIAANTNAIDALDVRVTQNEADIAAINSDISGVTGDISALQTQVATNTSQIGFNTTAIDTNTTNIDTLASRMDSVEGVTLQTQIDIASNTNAIATVDGRVDALLAGTTTDFDTFVEVVNAFQAADATLNGTLTQLVSDSAAADAVLQGQIDTNAGNIATNTAAIAQNTSDIAAIVQYSDSLVQSYVEGNNLTQVGLVDTTITWNATDETLEFPLNQDVTLQVGQETVINARNLSGVTLTNGTIVRITGASGEKLTVELADNSSEALSSGSFGVATQTINNNATGFVTRQGMVRDIDTSTFTEGDTIYLGTNGGFTNVKPDTPAHLVTVGWVVVSHATAGSIYVNIQNGYELEELHNVLITTAATGNLLQYNGTSWVNWTPDYATTAYTDAADAVLQGNIDVNTAAIATNTADIATNAAAIAANTADINTNSTAIAGNSADIVQLQTDVAGLGAGSGTTLDVGFVGLFNQQPVTGTWLKLDGSTYLAASYPSLANTPGYSEYATGLGAVQSLTNVVDLATTSSDVQIVMNHSGTGAVAVDSGGNNGYYTNDGGVTWTALGYDILMAIAAGPTAADEIVILSTSGTVLLFDANLGSIVETNVGVLPSSYLPSTTNTEPTSQAFSIATDGAGTFAYLPNDYTSPYVIVYNTTPYDLTAWTFLSTGTTPGTNLFAIAYYNNEWLVSRRANTNCIWSTPTLEATPTWNSAYLDAAGLYRRPTMAISGNTLVVSDFDTCNYNVYNPIDGWSGWITPTDGTTPVSSWFAVQGVDNMFIRGTGYTVRDTAYTTDGFANVTYEPTVQSATGYSGAYLAAGEVFVSEAYSYSGPGIRKFTFSTGATSFDVPNVTAPIPSYDYYVLAD